MRLPVKIHNIHRQKIKTNLWRYGRIGAIQRPLQIENNFQGKQAKHLTLILKFIQDIQSGDPNTGHSWSRSIQIQDFC